MPCRPLIQRRGVYPRVCGEASIGCVCPHVGQGLSPRVRGSLHWLRLSARRAGSIPACAGKPWRSRSSPSGQWVYPRVCGEAIIIPNTTFEAKGLSPRVRGSPALPTAAIAALGSIPACAGKPKIRSGLVGEAEVYPRVCGEARGDRGVVVGGDGLSPRVRGSPGSIALSQRRTWSIPACAGKPKGRPSSRSASRVYPRVCGEA